MITRKRRLNLFLSLLVILSLVSTPLSQASSAAAPEGDSQKLPGLSPPPGRNGLGLGQHENGNPADTPVQIIDGVNVSNGNFFTSDIHFQFLGLGPTFGFQIAYNSQADPTPGSIGRKWTHTLNVRLEAADNGEILLHKEDGEIIAFPLNCRQDADRSGGAIGVLDIQRTAQAWPKTADDPGYDANADVHLPLDNKVDILDVETVAGAFGLTCLEVDPQYQLGYQTTADGVHSQFVDTQDEHFELRTREGVVYRFWSPLLADDDVRAGKLRSVKDRNGNGYDLLYLADGLLATATGTSGAELQIAHSKTACPDAGPVIESVTDHSGRVVSYSYDPATCDLIGVERFGVPWRSYAYAPGSLLTSDSDANNKATTYAYDADSRVVSLQRPDTAAAQTYDYSTPGETTVTDAIGRPTRLQFDPNSRISQVSQAASGQVIVYAWDARGNLVRLGGPDGNDYAYDERGNLLSIETAHPDPASADRLLTAFTYDACNQVVSTTDALGRQTLNTYDPASCHLLQMRDEASNITQFANNAKGQPEAITDALGRQTKNEYDANGNLAATQDAAGNATQMVYDGLNRKVQEVDAASKVTRYEYDAFDRQTKIIAPDLTETIMTYDAAGNLLTSSDPDGQVTTYAYDGRGNKISVTDNAGAVTTYTYDDADRLVQISDPTQKLTQVDYDAQDRPIRVTANALGSRPQVTELTYDDEHLTRTIVNANGQPTLFDFDRSGNVVQVTDAMSGTIQYEYDLAGNLLGVTDARGNNESMAYDEAGRKISETDARGNTTQYEYDAAGNVIRISNGRGVMTEFDYDQRDQLAAVRDPLGGETQMAYDSRGNMTVVTDTMGLATRFAYDDNGNMSAVTNNASQTTQLEYSAAGRREALQSPLGNRIEFTLDELGRVASETKLGFDGLTATTQFAYDKAGNRSSMTDAEGSFWRYSYDDFGRLIAATDPLSNTTRYSYDALGNLTQKASADGICATTYSYDPLNRLISTNYSDGSAVTQSYDALGNALDVMSYNAAGDLAASTAFVYDERNQVIESSGLISPTLAYTISYQYDAIGNPAQKIYDLPGLALPVQIDQAWDAKNRLTHITRSEGAQVVVVEKQYDLEGRLIGSQQSVDGVAAAFTTYAYNPAGQVAQIQHCADPLCAVMLAQYNYFYDPDGNRIGEQVLKNEEPVALQYQYDGLGRLTGEMRLPINPPGPPLYQVAYAYDSVGNRLSEFDADGQTIHYQYDDAHQLRSKVVMAGETPVEQVLVAHDDRGNRVQQVSTSLPLIGQPDVEQFQYDCENRLTGYADPADLANQVNVYDGLGNKVAVAGTAGNRAFIYDGPNVVAEYSLADSAGPDLLASYLFGQEIDEPLARLDAAAGDPAFYLRDALGSVRQIIDQAGAVVNDYEYDAWGQVFQQTPGLPNEILFTGRWLDPLSGRYDFRTRVYDPEDGRFLQRDPIYEGLILAPCVACWQNPLEMMAVMPLYSYVGNNPATFTDPTGEQWWFWQPWWWVSQPTWYYYPYHWWGWWYGPWGWFGLRWWWWRWWWPANPFWGGWWWWQWRWWWGGWWMPWWGNFWWAWWWWGNWWWWPWWFGWGWWWYPWWWGGWWWPWWWFRWRGWWHWWWRWPFKWTWWCGWWWRWWWPWWWRGWWFPWWWLNWGGWRLGFWLGWGWWWWPWWWGGFWWPWWFGWGWWPWWGGWLWWRWWAPWWRPWWWGAWWWGPWGLWPWVGWYRWPWWWGGWRWTWWRYCRWSLTPHWWWHWWIWWPWWRPWWWRGWVWWPWWRPWWPLYNTWLRELGDAPDSSNHAGAAMTAYLPTGPPPVMAAFPTVYDPALGPPYGPMHRYPNADTWLGSRVSAEYDADLPYDWDGLTNLAPAGDLPDRDGQDDGIDPAALSLAHCVAATFDVTATVHGFGSRVRYLNVWVDWNQDGDWADALTCSTAGDAPEWAVQNQPVTLSGPAVVSLVTASFLPWNGSAFGNGERWLRISLTETPYAAGSAGAGPLYGFAYGETEDYLIEFPP